MEKVVVYAMGDYWKKNSDKIRGLFDIVACSDRDVKAAAYALGNCFISPEQISQISYDKIILGCKQRGVREMLVVQYGLPADRIFYYDEILNNVIRQRGKNAKKHVEHLTVVIPTYNRQQRLKRTLDILEKQSESDFDVIILDNCSDYDLSQVIDRRPFSFKNRIRIVSNRTNIGMVSNLANAFIQKMDGWVWMLSDDDIPSIYAVEDIYKEIEQCSNTGVIHFSTCEWDMYLNNNTKDFKSLHELMEFYRNIMMKSASEFNYSGDFIYFSNKVYNMKYVKAYYEEIFFYSYSGVPQLVPILFMLDGNTAGLRVSNIKIVVYDSNEENHWNWIKTMSGMRIITDFPLRLDGEDRKMLYRIIMGSYIDELIGSIDKSNMEFDIGQIEKIYEEVYQFSLDDKERRACKAKIGKLKEMMKTERK